MKTQLMQSAMLMVVLAGCGPVETDSQVVGDEVATSEDELRRVNPCALVRCAAGTQCVVNHGSASCQPLWDPCMAAKCSAGYHCDSSSGGAVCVSDDPCLMVKCWAGTHCEPAKGGGSSCVPDLTPCATVKCAAGFTCQVVNGQATCS